MYVPRALRSSRNATCMNDNKTVGSVDGTVTCNSAAADVTAQSQSVIVNDSSSRTVSEQLSDAKLSSTMPDCSQQSTKSSKDKKTIVEKLKTTSYRDSREKVVKRGQKSKGVSEAELQSAVVSSTSDTDSRSSQRDDSANCSASATTSRTVDDVVSVMCDRVHVASAVVESESICDADNQCQQVSAGFLLTDAESTDTGLMEANCRTLSKETCDEVDQTVLPLDDGVQSQNFPRAALSITVTGGESADNSVSLDQTEADCRLTSAVTADEVSRTVLSVDSDVETRTSPQSVSPVAVVGSELSQLSVRQSESSDEQPRNIDRHHGENACHVTDREAEWDVVLDIRLNDSQSVVTDVDTLAVNSADRSVGNTDTGRAAVTTAGSDDDATNDDDIRRNDLQSHPHDVADVNAALLSSAEYSAGNSVTGDTAAGNDDDEGASLNDADDDIDDNDVSDDDDDDSWEKLFDDSGAMLRHSDDTAEVDSCY